MNNLLADLSLKNPYWAGANGALLLYTAIVAPRLSMPVLQALDHTLVKMVMLLAVLSLLKTSHWATALMLVLAYGVTMYMLSRHNRLEVDHYVPLDKDYEGTTEAVQWESDGGINRFKHHGVVYENADVTNLLPGGHGHGDGVSPSSSN